MSGQDQAPTLPENFAGSPQTPNFFLVSPLKLIVMSVCTFGIYETYWFYRNWCAIKRFDQSNILPIWRAVLGQLFCYFLFRRIQATGRSCGISKSMGPGLLAVGWVLLTFLAWLPAPFGLVTLLAVLLLVPVQTAVNEMNKTTNPQRDANSGFTVWNIAAIVIGGLILALGLLASLVPRR